MYISELIYDPTIGRDVAHQHKLDYNPNAYKTKEAAARGFHKALVKFAKESYGYTDAMVEREIHLWAPERTKQYSGSAQWCVVWEAGPYDWAPGMFVSGPSWYTEPYYSFDLHFVDA